MVAVRALGPAKPFVQVKSRRLGMAVTEGTRRIVGGADTHKDLHVAAVVDEQDRVMETRSFATTRQGYRQISRGCDPSGSFNASE